MKVECCQEGGSIEKKSKKVAFQNIVAIFRINFVDSEFFNCYMWGF